MGAVSSGGGVFWVRCVAVVVCSGCGVSRWWCVVGAVCSGVGVFWVRYVAVVVCSGCGM